MVVVVGFEGLLVEKLVEKLCWVLFVFVIVVLLKLSYKVLEWE